MKKILILSIAAAIIFGVLSQPAMAAPHKLERGPKNIVLGWTEVPNAIVSVTKETNNPFLGITFGLVKGVLNAFARTASGVWDTASFPVNSEKDPAVKPTMID